MNDELEDLVRETKAIAEENNKILKGLRRSHRWGTFIRLVYWIIIIGLTIGALAYVQPYLDSITKMYNELESANSKITNTQNTITSGIKDFLFGAKATTAK